jgi:hypothetical protein
MRIIELLEDLDLQEGGDSKSTQFNSEVGLLASMCGVDPATFDPTNPAPSFANSPYTIGKQTLANIQSQAKSYDPNKFAKWVNTIGPSITNKVLEELTKLKYSAPTELAWVAGQNQSSVADIKFVNHSIDGISVKESGAPTLANLTTKSLGLDGDDPDVFRQHALAEWDAVKQYVFAKVIELAKAQPGEPFAPIKDKYSITYIIGNIPADANRLKVQKSKPVDTAPPAPAPATAAPLPANQPNDSELSENVSTGGYFVINFGDGSVNEPENRIIADLPKNAPWQRVFGDYFQAYWSKDEKLKQLGSSLFSKIGQDFVAKIKLGLAEDAKLHGVVKMGATSYFYATPKSTFYVPSINNNQGLKLVDLQYTAPKGTNQNFLATIGYQGQVPANVLIYIRYANGIFQTNPTVRVQKLTNPQGLGWIKI